MAWFIHSTKLMKNISFGDYGIPIIRLYAKLFVFISLQDIMHETLIK